MTVIHLHGDSTQLGAGDRLKKALEAKPYNRKSLTIENKGIGGLTCKVAFFGGKIEEKDALGNLTGNKITVWNDQGIAVSPALPGRAPRVRGIDPTISCWEEVMESDNGTVDIIIFNCGLNDAFIEGYGVEDHKYCLRQMAHQAKLNGKKFVIETPNPMEEKGRGIAVWDHPSNKFQETPTRELWGHEANLGKLVKAAREVAAANDDIYLVDQYNTIKNWYVGSNERTAHGSFGTIPNDPESPIQKGGWQGAMTDRVGSPGMHPTNRLYNYKAAVMAKVLVDLKLV